MDLKQAVIRVNQDPELLDKLRRFERGKGLMQRLRKDASGREYLEAQFNGVPYTFYLDQSRVFPLDVAKSLVRSSQVALDIDCPNCWDPKQKHSSGRTAAGTCQECSGKKKKFVGDFLPIFEIEREYDAMLVDPLAVAPRPVDAEA